MERESNLLALIPRAWALHDGINDAIQSTCVVPVGVVCSAQHGHQYCSCNGRLGDAGDPLAVERRSLIAIRDALQVFESLLLSFQRLQSRQHAEHAAALMRLEESRYLLIKSIREHPGRAPDMIQDILSYISGGQGTYNENAKKSLGVSDTRQDTKINNTRKKAIGFTKFLSSFFQLLFCPWKLETFLQFVGGLAVLSAGVFCVIDFSRSSEQRLIKSEVIVKEMFSSSDQKDSSGSAENSTKIKEVAFDGSMSSGPINVLCGRG